MVLSQKRFIDKILDKFGMTDAKACKTPVRTNQNKKSARKTKDKPESTLDLSKGLPYRQLVGSLMYLQGSARLDISFAVNARARC